MFGAVRFGLWLAVFGFGLLRAAATSPGDIQPPASPKRMSGVAFMRTKCPFVCFYADVWRSV